MDTGRQPSTSAIIMFLSIVMLAADGPGLFASDSPVADAGLPRYAARDAVRLDGTKSYDPDESGPLTYQWTQVSGSPVTISGGNTATPTISGFVQTEEIQECAFDLVVADGELTSSADTVSVVIVPTFTGSTMTLENASFDPEKPTVVFFHGGTSTQTGGGRLNAALWSEKANVISFPSYVADPGTFSGAEKDRSYTRPADMVIVYLSAIAPDYRQPIQTFGWSIGGLLALDVALRLNVTYADARYAVNHASLLDPSAWVLGTSEFHRRVALLLDSPVAGEQCWVASYEAANVSVCPSALNVVFPADHALPWNWYRNSLATAEDNVFNHGVVAGAYWSVVGPGRNLQLASTPGVQTYKFAWIGSATVGRMEFYDELNHPGRLPEPVTLGAWVNISDASGDIDGVVLSCHESENAVGYELLFGPDPYRVMDYRVVSDTPLPPMDIIRDLPSDETWWTIRVCDQHGSTIHADPVPLDLTDLGPLAVQNAQTGQRYGLIGHAILEAEPGDVILLDPGIYEESIEFGSTPLTVSSLDPNDPVMVAGTIIRGRDVEPTVTFLGSESVGSTLAGLTIQNETVGVSCRDAAPTIRSCVVESPDGIAVEFWHNRSPRFIDCTVLGQVREGGDPGLTAYWKFDEAEGSIAHDSEGDHDATVTGDPLWQPDAGMVGGALELDGATFVVSGAALNPSSGPFSAYAWVKGGAPGQVIVSQEGGANWLMADASQGALMTDLKGTSRSSRALSSETVITDGDWHRVGFVWDGSTRTLYVDDAVVAQDTQGGLKGSSGKLVIGRGKNMLPASFWSGLIDDVRIYGRAMEP